MKKEDKIQARREEILDAALDIFSVKGYHAAGIADIAGKLDIGHGTCYRYFKNKLDILHALLDRVQNGLSEVISRQSPDKSNSLEEYRSQIGEIGVGLFELFGKDTRIGQVFFFETQGIDETVTVKTRKIYELSARVTELYLINGVKKGFLRKNLDTDIASKAINSMMFEGIRQSISRKSNRDYASRWMQAVPDLMLDGMRTDS
ncbi:TetR/AcrR family transcriptional regulator [Leptospira yasudae]|uniref:TetR/AcrR family transcriptional regulator n=1 Tax=Leptospira yasudae TaxID=2202201 RepID=A0A6N4QP79_9LEPT|nr:TetR/AcrR family transcriptional regulator [Leptospira yasudae]TGL73288.1 TetR/AcrR family transcriptional regulator [Leptospira yasudae]TGL78460.1 TetR/AcrR family transcriptional regulator [Leptospira yasudae]TGL84893.1 TetR/AcrR family transcriptional regulator [Leptospira yasudae]